MSSSDTIAPTPRRTRLLELCAVVLIALLVLRFLPWRFGWVELVSNFLHWLLLPAAPLTIYFAWRRHWRSALLWLIPAIAFGLLFGELFLPARTSQPPGTRSLRVMTYNLFGLAQGFRDPQIELMRESGAAVIALQEVGKDAEAAITQQLLQDYPYQVLYPAGIAGTGLLSKHPLLHSEVLELTPGTFCVHALVDVEGTPLQVISAHPPPPITSFNLRYRPRGAREIAALLSLVDPAQPTLLLGDFNITDQSKDYAPILAAGFTDAWRTRGLGFGSTWPCRVKRRGVWPPVLRIDYIFHDANFGVERIWVGPDAVSDHRAVIADLWW